jgi:NADH dehydrogenase
MPAWMLARSYHLAMMPGAGRRARLLVDWNIGLLFGRDTAELGGVAAVKTEQTTPRIAEGTAAESNPTAETAVVTPR